MFLAEGGGTERGLVSNHLYDDLNITYLIYNLFTVYLVEHSVVQFQVV